MQRLPVYLNILLITLIPIYSIGQDNCDSVIEGFVFDLETKVPLQFATVKIENTIKGSTTDENGHFKILNICNEEVNIVVSFIGYKKTIHHHDIHHESPVIFLAQDKIHLESVVIEGFKKESDLYTISTSKLNYKEIEEFKFSSLSDIASEITGVSTLKTGQNISKPIIHGLYGNRVLIVNDGLVLNNQNWGDEHGPEIEGAFTNKVEVIKGAGSVRYGPEAMGGVMLINHPKPELEADLSGGVTLSGNTNGRSVNGLLEVGEGYKNFSWHGMASSSIQGDLNTPDYILTNTGKNENAVNFGTLYHKNRVTIDTDFSFFEQESAILRSSVSGNLNDLISIIEAEEPPLISDFSYTINNPRQVVSHYTGKVKLDYSLADQAFEVQYGVQSNLRQEYDVRRGTNNLLPSIDLNLFSQNMEAAWIHPEIGNMAGRTGIQWSFKENTNLPGTNTLPLVPNYLNNGFGLYLIEQISTNGNIFEYGIRYDIQFNQISGRDQNNQIFRRSYQLGQFTGLLGYTKKISQHSTFSSNFGTAWRPPNISELFSFGKHGASIEYGIMRYELFENGDIGTEIQQTLGQPIIAEKGLKWVSSYNSNLENNQFEVVNYYHLIFDYINSTPAGLTNTVRGAFPYFIYRQTDAFLWGIDLTWKRKLSKKLSNKLKGSYLWSKDIVNNTFFVGQPPLELSNNLAFEFNTSIFEESSIKVGGSYVFRQFQSPITISPNEILMAYELGNSIFEETSLFDFTDAPDGYFLMNFMWSAKRGKFHWIFSVNNLLNARYRMYTDRMRYFSDFTGRGIRLTIEYNF